MARSLLSDAFAHHTWATLRVLDACAALSPDQLAAPMPGTYGPIMDTLRHLVGADASYLHVLTGGAVPEVDDETLDLPAMRDVMERNGPAWLSLVESGLDPDAIVVRVRDDGSRTRTAMGIRLAQVIHHGTDHRSQVCTALTALGVEPPAIDAWDYGWEVGRFEDSTS